MSNTKKILFTTDRFDVIEKDDKVGIEPNYLSVAILPFVRDVKGLPIKLGVLKEYNKIKSKITNTVITGRVEGEDPDVLSAAQDKIQDVTGLTLQEPERWFFLGFLMTHKMINQDIPCFACDLTGINMDEIETEETEEKKNDKTSFSLVDVNAALDTDDCYIPAIFLKMFRYIFGHNINTVGDNSDDDSDDAKISAELLDIDNVISAGRNEDIWKIIIAKGADKDSIKSKVINVLGDDVKFELSDKKELKTE